MITTDVGLDLRLVDTRCAQQAGAGASLFAALRGGVRGACGSRMARVTLTPAAAAAAKAAGITAPMDVVICVQPKCGKALEDLKHLQAFLGMLR